MNGPDFNARKQYAAEAKENPDPLSKGRYVLTKSTLISDK